MFSYKQRLIILNNYCTCVFMSVLHKETCTESLWYQSYLFQLVFQTVVSFTIYIGSHFAIKTKPTSLIGNKCSFLVAEALDTIIVIQLVMIVARTESYDKQGLVHQHKKIPLSMTFQSQELGA